jgi:hypothetical protein
VRESLTADSIANDIRMTRSLHSGSFLIVEGESTDPRVYGRFVDPKSCQMVPAPGKELALGALDILENGGFSGVAAVVDADFWRLEGKEPTGPNLFITDGHDLETMILKSRSLEKLLAEFGSPAKLRRITQRGDRSLRKLLLDLACPLGYLRWISALHSLELAFRDIAFGRFIDRTTLTLDVIKMIRVVKHKSGRHDLVEDELHNAICELEDINSHDPWDVCCGHDLVGVLSLGLRTALGSNNAGDVKPELLQKFLRAGYEPDDFLETELCQSLLAWQAANEPFRILCARFDSAV